MNIFNPGDPYGFKVCRAWGSSYHSATDCGPNHKYLIGEFVKPRTSFGPFAVFDNAEAAGAAAALIM